MGRDTRAEAGVAPAHEPPLQRGGRRLERERETVVRHSGEQDRAHGDQEDDHRHHCAPYSWRGPDTTRPTRQSLIVVEHREHSPAELLAERAKANRPLGVEPEQFLVPFGPHRSEPSSLPEHGRQMEEVPDPRVEVSDGRAPPEQQDADEGVHDTDCKVIRQDPEESQRAICDRHRPETPGLLAPTVPRKPASILVIDLGRRDGYHPSAGETCPLRKVETCGYRRQQWVEPTETLGEVATDEHGCRLDECDFTDDVVLLEIDLSLVDPGIGLTKDVCRTPDRLQLVHRAGLEQFRSGQSGFVSLRFCHQRRERIRPGAGVGVEQPQVVDIRLGRRDGLFQALSRERVLHFVSDDDDLR